MKGTSPKLMVYRKAFVHNKNDEGCNQVCNEIERFLNNVQGEKHSFETLYKCLQEKDYGQEKESYLIPGKKAGRHRRNCRYLPEK